MGPVGPRAKAVGQRLSPARKAAELAARRQRLKRAAGITVRDPATAGAPEAGFEAARRSVPEFRGTEPSRRNAAPGPAPGPPGEAPARAPGLGQLLKLRLSELLEQREPDSRPRQDGPPTEAVEPLRSPLSVDRVADAGRRHEPWPQALAPTADRRGTGAGHGNDEVQPPAPAKARLLEDAPSPRDAPDDPFFDEAYRHGVDLS